MPVERIDTVIIGAGQAGLGVSRELVVRGIEHVVLERGRIGESWRSRRWDSFALNSPAWMNVLPGDPAPARPDDFPSAPEFATRLARFAFRSRLPVREGVTVRSLEPSGRRESLRVATSDGVLDARAVVVASGLGTARLPAAAAALPRSILQLHAAGYRSPGALPAGRVLVVGGGQSGVQIAEDLLEAGRDVLLATSTVGRLPRRYRGRDSFAWLVGDGFFDEPAGTSPPRPNPQISGAGGGHTVSYQQLERRGAVLLGGVAGVSDQRIRLRDDLARNIGFADAASDAIRRRIDAYIARTGIDAPAPEPDAADDPYPAGALPQGPGELDLRRAGVSAVIWATGFRPATGFLPAPLVGARGEITQRDGATAVPGLFVTGQPWLRTRRSGNILGVSTDAPHVAGLVARHLAGHDRVLAA